MRDLSPQSVRRPSQSQRILAALERGGWMTATAIHRSVGTCRLNSRISELRTRGHLIECRHVMGAGSGPDAYEYRLTVPSGEGEQTTPTRLTATSPAPTPSPKNPSMVCSLSPDGPARAFRWRGGSWYAACECGWRTRTHFDEQRARDDAAQHVRTHTPPERVEAARPVPEASRGWDDREHPELARDGGHDQDVAPKGSADGTGAETRHATHDGGGNPGSAPDAAFEQLRLVA